jgi:raffinose/stachyose/melibiose transport system permease protein
MKRPRIRWHIAVFLAPAVLVYTTIMILPLFNTLRLALYSRIDQERIFVGLQNFRRCLATRSGRTSSGMRSATMSGSS